VSCISAAGKVDRAAADAFIPYAAWFAFATIRNAEIASIRKKAERPDGSWFYSVRRASVILCV